MGITIHYLGKIDDTANVFDLDIIKPELSKIPREKVDDKSPEDIADTIKKLIWKKFGK
jgi:hypothetical protein